MIQSYIDTKNKRMYTIIQEYVYSLPMDNYTLNHILELSEGGLRSPKPGVEVLGLAEDIDIILTFMKDAK